MTACESEYSAFRIPALVRAGKTLLAFAEGRLHGHGDSGQIDIVMSSSVDGGRSWSAPRAVMQKAGYTCGNPVPIFHPKKKTIVLVFCTNPAGITERTIIAGGEGEGRRVWVAETADDYGSFRDLREITDQVRIPSTSWFATGPSGGVYLRNGVMAVPCNEVVSGMDVATGGRSLVAFSRDHGRTWERGPIVVARGGNEGHLTVDAGGRLLHVARCHDTSGPQQIASTSSDLGRTWSALGSSNVARGILCKTPIASFGGKIWLSTPTAMIEHRGRARRAGLTLFPFDMDGKQAGDGVLVDAGLSAYSDLVTTGESGGAILWERGSRRPYEEIVFAPLTTP